MSEQLTLNDVEQPEGACIYFGDRCTNLVPGNGRICADCLDAVRQKDREEYVP